MTDRERLLATRRAEYEAAVERRNGKPWWLARGARKDLDEKGVQPVTRTVQ